MQDGRIDEGRELGLAAHDVFGLAAHAIPDRIERGKLAALRIDLMHCHGCSPQFVSRAYSTAASRSSPVARRKVNPHQTASSKMSHPIGGDFREIKRPKV